LNPKAGFVVNCNNRNVGDGYPHFLGNTFLSGFRARRMTDLLRGREKLTVDDMARFQMDLAAVPGLRFAGAVRALVTKDADARTAVDLLAGWDGRLTADSVPGAVYKVAAYHMVRAILEPKLGEKLTNQLTGQGFHPVLQGLSEFNGRDSQLLLYFLGHPESWWVREAGGRQALLEGSLGRAVRWLRAELGRAPERWQWGRIHALTLTHAMSMKKPLDRIFNLGPVPMGGDSDTLHQATFMPGEPYHTITAAPSHRQIIDLGDLSASRMIHTPGQSGQLGSPHYDDMLEPWSRGESNPMLWDRSEVEAYAEGTLVLAPVGPAAGEAS